ncbi:response regulator transcription factor [Butyrivibrio sp. AE2032]|jgi:two-component system response regulator YesN|uniref:response regulator transcription factor n=1 Tax=Butyrivibrio sp. AE2032 TaxID=1458463 RepID=UPI00055816E7|nr:response regulator [Butyrivibrio sp. AE2032]
MYSVLIADDEAIIRKGLKSFVEKVEGFQVAGMAEDGQEALSLAEDIIPDICFVDINMPFVNGLDFIERLNLICPGCICIVVTGYDDFAYIQRALRLHVKDYLLKPVNEEEFYLLMEKLRDILVSKEKSNMIKNWMDNSGELLDDLAGDGPSYSEKVRSAREYVKENFSDPELSLAQTADHIHVSVPYLSKIFKEETGDSFQSYLQRLRLSKAMAMLKDEDNLIVEIASSCGYSSQHYFSTAFKKELGMSPADYRKSVLGKETV